MSDDTIAVLRREITTMRRSLEEKNRQLDTLGRVWCDGGCKGGMHRYTDEPVIEEQVAFLERNAARARSWLTNRLYKDEGYPADFCPPWKREAIAEGRRLERAAIVGLLRSAKQAAGTRSEPSHPFAWHCAGGWPYYEAAADAIERGDPSTRGDTGEAGDDG